MGAAWSPDGGRITSYGEQEDGTRVLHGVQVVVGPRNWLKEYAVYNLGQLEQRTQFYRSGKTFRTQRREHNGDGYEVTYAPEAKQSVNEVQAFARQEVLCHGTVKADRRWEGTFLVWESIPNGYGLRLAVQEYRNGNRAGSTPFAATKLGLPEDWEAAYKLWWWDALDWPRAR